MKTPRTPKTGKPETLCIRKEWPRVTWKETATSKGWNINARKRGTNGKEEFRASRKEALERAAQIAAEYAANGNEGLALPAELRHFALTGTTMLAPFGKTVLQACEFYRDFLSREKEKDESALVSLLAEEWHTDKKDPKHKLKRPTIAGIRQTANLLKAHFAGQRIKAITEQQANDFIDSLNGEYQRENTRSRCSQFYNWCMKAPRRYVAFNPFKEITVVLPQNDITIFCAKEAQDVMSLCEKDYKQLVVYLAVSLFAGLRPGEAELLTWENIYLGRVCKFILPRWRFV